MKAKNPPSHVVNSKKVEYEHVVRFYFKDTTPDCHVVYPITSPEPKLTDDEVKAKINAYVETHYGDSRAIGWELHPSGIFTFQLTREYYNCYVFGD